MANATTKNEYTVIDCRKVTRAYEMSGTQAIIQDQDGKRYFIEDGFGGMDDLRGGAVRWTHGSIFALQNDDTFASLDAVSPDFEMPQTTLYAMTHMYDSSRPWLQWNGVAIDAIAAKLGL